MKYAFLSLASIWAIWLSCGSPKPREQITVKVPAPNPSAQNCDGKAIGTQDNNLKCDNGYLGTITRTCIDKGDYATWEVTDSTCRPPPSQCEADSKTKITWEKNIKPLGLANCVAAGCHASTLFDDYDRTLSIADEGLRRLRLGDDNNRRMPPPPKPALAFDQIQLWEQWINDGLVRDIECPDPDVNEARINLNTDFVQSNLNAALALDGRGQLNARFVTCDTQFNYGVSEDELDVCRDAINDAINAVSDQPIMQVCSDVDAIKGSCRIDLENLGLTFTDWEYIVRSASLVFIDDTDQGKLLRDVTGTDVPALTVDQFVEGAIKDTTNYYNFLGIPHDLNEYFLLKGINLEQEIIDFRASFAGMSDSEVSARKNRLMIFLDSDDGMCSITLDPADAANEESNLAQFPLFVIGQKQFFFDASETICTMENGNQEYALWNAAGVRQDVAPTNIVVDFRGGPIHGDFEIANALDCFGCHRAGFNIFQEEIRDAVIANAGDFDAEDILIVRELYLTQDRLDTKIARYNEEFRDRLKTVGVDTLAPDPITRWQDTYRLPWSVDMLCGHIRLPLSECIEGLKTTSVAGDLAPLFDGRTLARAVLDRIFNVIVEELRIGQNPINGGN